MKTCAKCGEEKPLTEFNKAKTCLDGVRGDCKSCFNARNKDYYNSNREKHLAKAEAYRAANKEKIREYQRLHRSADPSKQRAYAKAWRTKNKCKTSELASKYRAAKLQRTASWANDQLIAAYYKEAKRLEELTGIQFHVDHIIPLQGELVSGLHVETNLQLLPANENQGKSNRFDPETFVA